MVRRPPHSLVTTPESLFILLTAERSRRALCRTRTVIVDEIHALVDDKRGSHLALTLARLDDLVTKAGGARLQRVGLSATVRPIEDVTRFLHGTHTLTPACSRGEREQPERPTPTTGDDLAEAPDVSVVDSGHRRQLDLAVEVPRDELGVVATNEMWAEMYERLAELILAHRTTLVFVNTRRLSERVVHHLALRLGDEAVLAHHGSLSRRLRQTAESRLKAGRLRAVVATASLELGIDIRTVDLVCQIGSPRSIAVTLQRVGRSGHQVDTPDDPHVPKGRLFETTRDELIECAALVHAIRHGRLDRLAIPDWPVDVLAQQLVAACACEGWRVDDFFDLVRRASPYAALPRPAFDALTTRGASFLAELVRAPGRLASEVEDGLWELVAAGLVTADGFDNLRALVDPKRRRGAGRGRAARPRHSAGRWALLDEPDVPQPAGEPVAAGAAPARHDEVVARFASQMLDRWGVVFRDLLARETLAPSWRELLAALRRMEARGEIRGGRFVAGFVGEQFARPDAVELLRVVCREKPLTRSLSVPAADPLNLTGIVLPGPRVSALSGGLVELLPAVVESEPSDERVPRASA